MLVASFILSDPSIPGREIMPSFARALRWIIALYTGSLAVTLEFGCGRKCDVCDSAPGQIRPTIDDPPNPNAVREFRAVFVTTAWHLDWPEQPNTAREEIHRLVERTRELNCNVIMLQVRAFADRIHKKTTLEPPEPWSKALNNGNDPDPNFDPLSEWIDACHASGIELHLWVNPFRVDPNHIPGNPPLPTVPGDFTYLDASDARVQNYLLGVIEDLIRYKSGMMTGPDTEGTFKAKTTGGEGPDGLIFDHYMPPPPFKPPTQPSGAAPQATRRAGTSVPRNPSLDAFIKNVFTLCKAEKVEFGISPAQTDPNEIDPNAAEWVKKPWCHYVVPEVYVERGPGNPNKFEKNLKKWLDVTSQPKPIVVAGLYTTKVQAKKGAPWKAQEILGQIKDARKLKGHHGKQAAGQAHYSWRALRSKDHGGPKPPDHDIGDKLKKKPGNDDDRYDEPRLPPEYRDDLDSDPPDAPNIVITVNQAGVYTATFEEPVGVREPVRFWAVWLRNDGKWEPMKLYGKNTPVPFTSEVAEVAARGIDRYNRVGALARKEVP
jgi:uncharacterized lipoprotein YddW (UPF0748 family)